MKCINTNKSEFRAFFEQVNTARGGGISEGVLSSLAAVYQEENNTEDYPSIDYVNTILDAIEANKKASSTDDIYMNFVLNLAAGAEIDNVARERVLRDYITMFGESKAVKEALNAVEGDVDKLVKAVLKSLDKIVVANSKKSKRDAKKYLRDNKYNEPTTNKEKVALLARRLWDSIVMMFSPMMLGGYNDVIAYAILTKNKNIDGLKLNQKIKLISDGGYKNYTHTLRVGAASVLQEFIEESATWSDDSLRIHEAVSEYLQKGNSTFIDILEKYNAVEVRDGKIYLKENGSKNLAAAVVYLKKEIGLISNDIMSINDKTGEIVFNEGLLYLLDNGRSSNAIITAKNAINDIKRYNEFASNARQRIKSTLSVLEGNAGSFSITQTAKLKALNAGLELLNVESSIVDAIQHISNTIKEMKDEIDRNIKDGYKEEGKSLLDKLKSINNFYNQFMSLSREIMDDFSSHVKANEMFRKNANISEEDMDLVISSFDEAVSSFKEVEEGFKVIRRAYLHKYIDENGARLKLSPTHINVWKANTDYFFNEISSYQRYRGNIDKISNEYLQVIIGEMASSVAGAKFKANEDIKSLRLAYKKMIDDRDNDLTQSDFYERDIHGVPTGNYISKYNRGEYLRSFREFESDVIALLAEKHKDDVGFEPISTIDQMSSAQMREYRRAMTSWKFIGRDYTIERIEYEFEALKKLNDVHKGEKDFVPLKSPANIPDKYFDQWKTIVADYEAKSEYGKEKAAKLKESQEAYDAWAAKISNAKMTHSPAYYEIYDRMNDYNLATISALNSSMAAVLGKYMDENGELDTKEITEEDYITIDELHSTKAELAEVVNADGSNKTGLDLENALNYRNTKKLLVAEGNREAFEKLVLEGKKTKAEYEEWLKTDRKGTVTEFDFERFNRDKASFEKLVSENKKTREEFDQWLKRNKKEVNTKDFWDNKMANLDREVRYSKEQGAIAYKRNALIRIGKGPNGVISKAVVLAKVRELDEMYSKIGSKSHRLEAVAFGLEIYNNLPQSIKYEIDQKVIDRNTRTFNTKKYKFDDIVRAEEHDYVARQKDEISREKFELNKKLRKLNPTTDSKEINKISSKIKSLNDSLSVYYYKAIIGGRTEDRPLSIYSDLIAIDPSDREESLSSYYIKNDSNDDSFDSIIGDIPSDNYLNTDFDKINKNKAASEYYKTLIDTNSNINSINSGSGRKHDKFKAAQVRKTWRDMDKGSNKTSLKDYLGEDQEDEIQLLNRKTSNLLTTDQSGRKIRFMQMWYKRELKNMNQLSMQTINVMYKFALKAREREAALSTYGLLMNARGALADSKTLGSSETATEYSDSLKRRNAINISKNGRPFVGSNADMLIEDTLDKYLYGITDLEARSLRATRFGKFLKWTGRATGWLLIRTKIVPFITNKIQSVLEAPLEVMFGDKDSSLNALLRASKYVANDLGRIFTDRRRLNKTSKLGHIMSEFGGESLSFYDYDYTKNASDLAKQTAVAVRSGIRTVFSGYDAMFDTIVNGTMMAATLAEFRFIKNDSGEYEMVTRGRYEFSTRGDKTATKWNSLPSVLDVYEEYNEGFKVKDEFKKVMDANRGDIARRAQTKVAMYSSGESAHNRGKLYTDKFMSLLITMKGWMNIIYDRTWRGIQSGGSYSVIDQKMQMGFLAYYASGGAKSTKARINDMFTEEEAKYQQEVLRRSARGNAAAWLSFTAIYGSLATMMYLMDDGDPDDDDNWFEAMMEEIAGVLGYKLLSEKTFPLFPNPLASAANKTTNNMFIPEYGLGILAALFGGGYQKTGPYSDIARFYTETLKYAPFSDWYFSGKDRDGSLWYQKQASDFLLKTARLALVGSEERFDYMKSAKSDLDDIYRSSSDVSDKDMYESVDKLVENDAAADLTGLRGTIAKLVTGYPSTEIDKFKAANKTENYDAIDRIAKEGSPYKKNTEIFKQAIAETTIRSIKSTMADSYNLSSNPLAEFMMKKELLKLEEYSRFRNDVTAKKFFVETGYNRRISEAQDMLKRRYKNNPAKYKEKVDEANELVKELRSEIIPGAISLINGKIDIDENTKRVELSPERQERLEMFNERMEEFNGGIRSRFDKNSDEYKERMEILKESRSENDDDDSLY